MSLDFGTIKKNDFLHFRTFVLIDTTPFISVVSIIVVSQIYLSSHDQFLQ